MNSKVLRIVSYILIPILFLGIFIPSTYYMIKTDDKENLIENHFNSESFSLNYMYELREEARNLIYNKDYYYVRQDQNITIRYTAKEKNYNIGEYYFLIIYKDIAYTNVNNTEDTNTIEKIKNYINNFSDNYVEISKGNITTNNDSLKISFANDYQLFNMTYYSKVEKESKSVTENTNVIVESDVNVENLVDDLKIIEEVKDENGEVVGMSEVTTTGEREINGNSDYYDLNEYEMHQVVVNDFEIYSNYNEVLPDDYYSQIDFILSDMLGKYEEHYIYILPISVVLFILVCIYLFISIGHQKDSDEINLNDFDKIYIEISGLVIGFIVTLLIGGLIECIEKRIFRTMSGISIMFTLYIALYIFVMILFITIIKRIKAKKFTQTSIIFKVSKWCFNKLMKFFKWTLKLLKQFKSAVLNILDNKSLFIKICIFSVLLLIIMIYILALLGIVGAVIDAWLFIFVLYGVYKYLHSVKLIENHLKEIYEGKNVEDIDLLKVEKELKNMAVYVNNISDGLENLVEEQMKSERMKTELITNVSHDIKTPLTSIINYIDLLKKENIESEKAKEYLDVLDSKSQRLKKLIEDLVDASKASSGTVKLKLEKINVKELMMQSIGEFEDKFKAKGLKVELKTEKDEICTLADAKYLYRVIDNTFSNIEKYALENTRVYVDLREKDGEVLLDIKNISKDELNISSEELMQRFVRGDKSRTTEGSGLGLSISKSLIELQKGKFNITIDGDLFKVSISLKVYKK